MPRKAEYDRIKLRMAEDQAFADAWRKAKRDEGKARRAAGNRRHQTKTTEQKARDMHKRWLTYGWTAERVADAKQTQSNRCAVCGLEKPLVPDHGHTDPPIPRGMLCQTCNRCLGYFGDSAEICEAAAAYLRRYSLAHH